MRSRVLIGIGAIAAALLVAGCKDSKSAKSPAGGAPVAAVAAPNGGDWTQTASLTGEGGYLMGNPNAPVKLVEYASYTCPHCAEFAEAGTQTLEDKYVKSGRVSWEFRPFLLFPTDPGITLLVRCQGPAAAFLLADQLYATQREWVGRIQALPEEQQAQFNQLGPLQQMPALIQASGLDQFFRQRGMPEAKISSCLADQRETEKIVAIRDRASRDFKVTGTPTFFINGEMVQNAASWDALRPALEEAVGE